MTKKDYELFANEIHETLKANEPEDVQTTIEICKAVFKRDNPAFQSDKFERACYEGKHIRKSISGRV